MPLPRGFSKSTQAVSGFKTSKGPRTFWMPGGTETTVVFLDDQPVRVCRHKLFIKGDRTAAQMRQTCAGMNPDEYPRPVPKMCVVCNAQLRHPQIGRNGFYYYSIIDERKFTYKGRNYQDMKQLLELPPDAGELFERKAAAHGGLKGMRFRVYRSTKQNSARHGDDWQPMNEGKPVDLVRHYWYSPGVKALIEAKQRSGERAPEYADAVNLFIQPYDYDKTMGEYVVEDAETFIAYVGASVSTTAAPSGGGSSSGGSYGDVPPPPPGGGASPNYSTGSVPRDSVPQTPPPPPAQDTPPWDPQQGQHAPPPPPDPRQASGRQPAPPPPPQQQAQNVPPPPPPQNATPQQAAPPPPPAQQPAAPAAVGNNYDFEQGWGQGDDPLG